MPKAASLLARLPLLLVVVVASRSTILPNDRTVGFRAEGIAEAAAVEKRSIGGAIIDVRLVLPEEGQAGGVVFEILKAGTWRIAFVALRQSHFVLAWVSQPLGSPFEEVVANSGLEIVSLRGETMVLFRGCAMHMCPDVFGFVLFRLHDGKSFKVTVSRIKENVVEYSPELMKPDYKVYRDYLDERVKEQSPFAPK